MFATENGALIQEPMALMAYLSFLLGGVFMLAQWKNAAVQKFFHYAPPLFFVAVGSQGNIGGTSSAPVVASVFQPALAPVGLLMGIIGNVVGTYGAVACAYLAEIVSKMF